MSREPDVVSDVACDDANDYVTRIVTDLAQIAPQAWDALVLTTCGRLHPALRHTFLHGLHTTGCACAETGWEPEFLTLWRGSALEAAAPLYRKLHSYGEYVFDWAWADALQRAGGSYYPKLLCALPFSPVSAPKLLAVHGAARQALAAALISHARASGLSSLHVLFAQEEELALLNRAGLMTRTSVQFHWSNAGYKTFDDFLATLSGAKRRKIRADRRKVAEAGVDLRCLRGSEATQEDWDFVFECYARTYLEHRSTPYLTHAFFQQLRTTMGDQVLLVMARRESRCVASTLSLMDGRTLYGRYWGALENIDSLHFEACYYTPIEYCILHRIEVFEGGAQGEHKLARGFHPVPMQSAHWISHDALSHAVARYLARESSGMAAYLDELNERSPYARMELAQDDGAPFP